jgi:beta-lactamase superfamily II metal-dependent hydrolase
MAFDVGQGVALLVETQHHQLLYDSGPLQRRPGLALGRRALRDARA